MPAITRTRSPDAGPPKNAPDDITERAIRTFVKARLPRLQQASLEARNNCRLIGGGVGINWPDLDEDISVEGLLATH